MLRSNGSWGPCPPKVFPPASLPLARRTARTLEAVKLVLELGADVNAANNAGDTALHAAAYKGFGSVVQLLVDKGGDMNAKNKRGKTPQLCYERGKVARCMGVAQ